MNDIVCCVICGQPCDLSICKVTYDGKPAHDECVVRMILMKNAQTSKPTEC